MKLASKNRMYEEAARLRDRIKSINQIQKLAIVVILNLKTKLKNTVICGKNRENIQKVIYSSDLIYELSSVDGVRAVNFIELTQDFDLYNYSEDYDITPLFCNDADYSTLGECNPEGSAQYGWKYDFSQFYDPEKSTYRGSGIILPSKTPAVFELKNPNKNIIGVVH